MSCTGSLSPGMNAVTVPVDGSSFRKGSSVDFVVPCRSLLPIGGVSPIVQECLCHVRGHSKLQRLLLAISEDNWSGLSATSQ